MYTSLVVRVLSLCEEKRRWPAPARMKTKRAIAECPRRLFRRDRCQRRERRLVVNVDLPRRRRRRWRSSHERALARASSTAASAATAAAFTATRLSAFATAEGAAPRPTRRATATPRLGRVLRELVQRHGRRLLLPGRLLRLPALLLVAGEQARLVRVLVGQVELALVGVALDLANVQLLVLLDTERLLRLVVLLQRQLLRFRFDFRFRLLLVLLLLRRLGGDVLSCLRRCGRLGGGGGGRLLALIGDVAPVVGALAVALHVRVATGARPAIVLPLRWAIAMALAAIRVGGLATTTLTRPSGRTTASRLLAGRGRRRGRRGRLLLGDVGLHRDTRRLVVVQQAERVGNRDPVHGRHCVRRRRLNHTAVKRALARYGAQQRSPRTPYGLRPARCLPRSLFSSRLTRPRCSTVPLNMALQGQGVPPPATLN